MIPAPKIGTVIRCYGQECEVLKENIDGTFRLKSVQRYPRSNPEGPGFVQMSRVYQSVPLEDIVRWSRVL